MSLSPSRRIVRRIVRRIARRAGVAAAVAAVSAAAVLAFAGGPASAKTSTLHFFSKAQTDLAYHANGQPITNQNAQPSVGDYFISSDLDYVGNHKSHAKNYTASDNLACTITQSSSTSIIGICDGVIAVGGSMLLANHVTVNLGSNNPTVAINGGTGQYKNARGAVVTSAVANTNNTDFTITYTT
ncbi:MAG TPA: hypothetical protein VMR97_14575 [Acidimicrobiales bacterium]|nr:hypothetical protein [Acidimicrobiales bacterium]